jgi:hypothetical protein
MTELAIYAEAFALSTVITFACLVLVGIVGGISMTVYQLFRDASCVTVGDLLHAIRHGARFGTIVVYFPALCITEFLRVRVLNPLLRLKIYTAPSVLRSRR